MQRGRRQTSQVGAGCERRPQHLQLPQAHAPSLHEGRLGEDEPLLPLQPTWGWSGHSLHPGTSGLQCRGPLSHHAARRRRRPKECEQEPGQARAPERTLRTPQCPCSVLPRPTRLPTTTPRQGLSAKAESCLFGQSPAAEPGRWSQESATEGGRALDVTVLSRGQSSPECWSPLVLPCSAL